MNYNSAFNLYYIITKYYNKDKIKKLTKVKLSISKKEENNTLQ